MRVQDLVSFIKAREAARLGKGRDPIIAKYRFCNVRRNDDRATKWIFEHVLEKHRDCPDLWFRLTAARLFNLPSTIKDIEKLLVPFKPEKIREVLHAKKARGEKIFNAAYIVSTNGRAMDKIDYVVQHILQPMWVLRANFKSSMRGATLEQVHETLMGFQGLGSFMAAQVLADLKYADPDRWPDFYIFAASGPGSRRGLSRVVYGELGHHFSEKKFREILRDLQIAVNRKLKWDEPLTAQDLQNCLCEFDKYQRAVMGEGTPKQIYKPYEGD